MRHSFARHPAAYLVGAWRIAVGSAAHRAGARHAGVKSVMCRARPGHIPVRGAVGQAWTEVRDELARRAHGRVPGLTGPRLVRLLTGRSLAGAPRHVTVVVVLDRYRFARSRRLVFFLVLMPGRLIAVIQSVGMAARQAVRLTAEAGVATFHQIPPGP